MIATDSKWYSTYIVQTSTKYCLAYHVDWWGWTQNHCNSHMHPDGGGYKTSSYILPHSSWINSSIFLMCVGWFLPTRYKLLPHFSWTTKRSCLDPWLSWTSTVAQQPHCPVVKFKFPSEHIVTIVDCSAVTVGFQTLGLEVCNLAACWIAKLGQW